MSIVLLRRSLSLSEKVNFVQTLLIIASLTIAPNQYTVELLNLILSSSFASHHANIRGAHRSSYGVFCKSR